MENDEFDFGHDVPNVPDTCVACMYGLPNTCRKCSYFKTDGTILRDVSSGS